MESKSSLKYTATTFFLFLFICAFDNVDKIYIPLKHSIADQKIPEIWIYSTELLTFLIFGISLIKVMNNVTKQKFFIKQNVHCFQIMAVALMLPAIVKTLGDIFDTAHDWHSFPMDLALWFAASLFLSLMGNIFRYGLKLKEEQDLTI